MPANSCHNHHARARIYRASLCLVRIRRGLRSRLDRRRRRIADDAAACSALRLPPGYGSWHRSAVRLGHQDLRNRGPSHRTDGRLAGSAWLAAGSLPASLLTLPLISRQLHSSSAVATLISYVLGYALLLSALSLLLRRRILALAHVLSLHRRPRREAAATVLLGALLGVLVSLSSVGAGAIGVTMLVLLYPHLPIARIVGTDIAHAVPLTLVAGLGHLAVGTVDVSLLASLLIGSLPGIALGSVIASRAPERALRLLLAGVLTLVGIRLVAT